MTLDEALAQLPTRRLGRADAEALCLGTGRETDSTLNELALELANKYMAGSITFEQADEVINVLFAWAAQTGRPPEPMFSVYLAFDAGEWLRSGEDADPEVQYTRPQLRKILSGNVPAA